MLVPPPRSTGSVCHFTGWLSAALLTALLNVGCGGEVRPSDTATLDTLQYVGRAVCAGCHADEARAWQGSDHDRAMEPATAEHVLGDFDGATFTSCGVETQFFREGERFFVRTQGPDGQLETYPVEYTFGYDPLQQYLLPLEGGRLQAFTVAWDTRRERWFSLLEDDCPEPADWLHWTGRGMNWNYMCADCHSTDLQRNFDLASGTYETSYAEMDVSCEACHGPGEAHVERVRVSGYDANSSGLTVDLSASFLRAAGGSGEGVSGLASREDIQEKIDLAASHRQVATCAPCHSRRRIIHPKYVPGKPFFDHYEPELLEDGLYFADGQIDDEVFVYGSFVQSKMYASGVTCSDCHDPHSTRLRLEGNALCSQCHAPSAYDTFEHIRHPEGSEGAQCVDCHMPARTYMVVDPRRDHSFKVPRPDLTAEVGTPNPCTTCHEDRSAEWAAGRIADWHGPDRPPTFARAIAGGRSVRSEAEPELIGLVADEEAPEIVRATALSLVDRFPTVRASEASLAALEDPSPLVRATAVRNLNEERHRSAAPRIEALLTDSVRLVRIEAARLLTQIAPGRYHREDAGEIARAYWSALREYREGQLALADQPAAHLNLAVLHEQLGEPDSAAAAYESALRLDSSFVPAHLNLAMLYNRQREGGDDDRLVAAAEASLRAAVRLQPEMAEAHYTLGLLLAESPERLGEAAGHLARAADLDTTDARIQYNAGLAHQQLGRAAEAERLLLRASRLEPDHPDNLNALSVFYAQQEEWETALTYTDRLLQHFPNNPDVRQRAAYLQQQLRR